MGLRILQFNKLLSKASATGPQTTLGTARPPEHCNRRELSGRNRRAGQDITHLWDRWLVP